MEFISAPLNLDHRSNALADAVSNGVELLVVGGGITGAGIALDAASRGINTLLIEQSDLAAGTSSRSSKLIHGGLRYLENYDFKLVREALLERELMVTTLAPHLVKPLSFIYPLTQKVRERTYVGAGLALYDALRGLKRALPNHRHLSQDKLKKIAPALNPKIVVGGIEYSDAQVDDARHTATVARTAVKIGAKVATRTTLLELIKDDNKIIGAILLDQLTGKKLKIKVQSVALACGIWNSEIAQKAGVELNYSIAMSKGVHIMVPKSAINAQEGIIIKTAVSVLFIIPWKEYWLIGTTDTPYEGDKANPIADESDINYILDMANKFLEPKISQADILGVFAGIRPLVASSKKSKTTEISREHIVDRPMRGLLSIAGGKYTTYRVMAADLVDLVYQDIRRAVPKSATEKIPLLGAEQFYGLVDQKENLARKFDLSLEQVTHLLDRYGSLIFEIESLWLTDPKLKKEISEVRYLAAEFVYSVVAEGALDLIDIFARRTRIAFEVEDGGMAIAPQVAKLVAPYLSWKASDQKRAVADYLAWLSSERRSLQLNEGRNN
jgi:glycerol-3-phosphate dehydrogenase